MTATSPDRVTASAMRPVARWLLVAFEVVIAVNAVYGGIGLMVNGMGMPNDWLDATPFHSWTVPGFLLLAVVAVPMSVAVVGELVRWRRADAASMLAGVVLVGWIAVQVLVLRRYFVLQPVLGVAGALVVALAWRAHPHPRRSSR
jgi:hypothetical protein